MQKTQIKEKLKSAIQIFKKTKDPRAAEVMISKKNCKIIRQRETINDLINGQKVVAWFK